MAESVAEPQTNTEVKVDITTHSSPTIEKVTILLKPTGDAPIIKQKKFTVNADLTIAGISQKIKQLLKLETNERIFLYVHQTFAPPPDQILRNLYECYNTEGNLILHYCKTQAWG